MPVREYAPLCLTRTPAGGGSSRLGVDRRPCFHDAVEARPPQEQLAQRDHSVPAAAQLGKYGAEGSRAAPPPPATVVQYDDGTGPHVAQDVAAGERAGRNGGVVGIDRAERTVVALPRHRGDGLAGVPAGARACPAHPCEGRKQGVRLVEVPGQLLGAEPDGGPVAHEVVADLVAFLHQPAHQRLAPGDSLSDQEEGGPCCVPPELGQDQRRGALVGSVVQGQGDQSLVCLDPIEATGESRRETIHQPDRRPDQQHPSAGRDDPERAPDRPACAHGLAAPLPLEVEVDAVGGRDYPRELPVLRAKRVKLVGAHQSGCRIADDFAILPLQIHRYDRRLDVRPRRQRRRYGRPWGTRRDFQTGVHGIAPAGWPPPKTSDLASARQSRPGALSFRRLPAILPAAMYAPRGAIEIQGAEGPREVAGPLFRWGRRSPA
jgi:hypothetical protein